MDDTLAQDETLKQLVELARQTERQVDRVSELMHIALHITDESALAMMRGYIQKEIVELTRLSKALVELPRSGEKQGEPV